MRLANLALAASLAAALAACGQDNDERAAAPAESAPSTASGGASSGGLTTGPKGERIEQPLAPPQTAQSAQDVKPDPGDANDHSNPQHDSRDKKNGD